MTRPRSPRSATLHEVAHEAGVSLMTVSRALSHPDLVSKATRERVQAAVARTGYIPNLLAGGLKSKRSLTIAALVPIISVPQFLPTIRALTDTFDAAGYQLILGQTGYDHAREDQLVATLMGRRPDGMVITGLLRSAQARTQLRAQGIPVVETWDLGEDPVDMAVGFSHAEVGSAVADFFQRKGWTRVGIATGDDDRAMQRCTAFQLTLGGAVPTAVVAAPSSLASGRAALAELLARDPGIEAIHCSSDGLTQGVMVEAQARGLRIPQDLALCGFGDADFAAHLHPSLTTVQVDGARIGQLAARMILDRCAGRDVTQPVVDLGFRIVERESTGGPTSLATP